jgi:hypothetical protein
MTNTGDQTGRTPRQTTGGSPAASTIMIVVTVVAVVVGFFILKSIRDDGGGSSGNPPATAGPGATTTTLSTASSTLPGTTVAAEVKTGTKVQVANASGVGGVAGKMTDEIKAAGFDPGKATNSTGPKLSTSVVYYDSTNPAAQPVAETLARTMGLAAPQPLPSPIPVTGGKLDTGSGVLLMLGSDKANQPLSSSSTSPATTAGATSTTKA